METSTATQAELAMAMTGTHSPTPDHTYSTIVSYPMPNAANIYSVVTTTSPVPSTLVPICDAITDRQREAHGQGPHPTLLAQPTALLHSTMSEQTRISTPIVSPNAPFKVHLDRTDLDFLKRLGDCQVRKKENSIGRRTRKSLCHGRRGIGTIPSRRQRNSP